MTTKQLISVIMTAYNAENYIGEAIESVINQSYQNWELLIADDLSTDNTKKLIDKYAGSDNRIRVFHNERNLNYLRTRNKLFDFVKGDFITFLDADDLSETDRLQIQLEAFDKHRNLGMCGCMVKYIDKDKNPLTINNKKPLDYQDIIEYAKSRNPFTGSSITVRASIIKEMGGYRDFFSGIGNEDYDLTSRIIEKHYSINLPESLYIYRQLDDSTSRSTTVLFDPYRQHGEELVKFFISERAETGIDSLDRNDYPRIRDFILRVHKSYVDDPSKLYRELASGNLYYRLYDKAITYSKQAVLKNPFKMINYRTLFYCLRKSILK